MIQLNGRIAQWMIFALFGWLFFALSWILPAIRFIIRHH
jgi:hypothetical protein